MRKQVKGYKILVATITGLFDIPVSIYGRARSSAKSRQDLSLLGSHGWGTDLANRHSCDPWFLLSDSGQLKAEIGC